MVKPFGLSLLDQCHHRFGFSRSPSHFAVCACSVTGQWLNPRLEMLWRRTILSGQAPGRLLLHGVITSIPQSAPCRPLSAASRVTYPLGKGKAAFGFLTAAPFSAINATGKQGGFHSMARVATRAKSRRLSASASTAQSIAMRHATRQPTITTTIRGVLPVLPRSLMLAVWLAARLCRSAMQPWAFAS